MNVRGGSDYPGGNPGGYDDDDRYGSSQGNYDRYNLGADRWGGHDRYKDDRGSSRDNYDEYAHDPYDDRGSVPSVRKSMTDALLHIETRENAISCLSLLCQLFTCC